VDFFVKNSCPGGVFLGASQILSMRYYSNSMQWLRGNFKGKCGIFSLLVLLGVFG